ncbi:5-methyltetrahydropteroyltriglutamate--homocysteine methyltransferase [bacterium HR19]|nr:5-methyltetrahydropteroyltriglutamate--homocysteine methyltransferase [bacterium HR19]
MEKKAKKNSKKSKNKKTGKKEKREKTKNKKARAQKKIKDKPKTKTRKEPKTKQKKAKAQKITKKKIAKEKAIKKQKPKIKFFSAISGSYPRIGDTEELQKLRRAWAKREVGEISDEEYREVEKEFIKLAIEEQEKAGLDIIGDGMISWYDQISHFAKNIEGVKINGLLRFFDTNTYFRQPIIDDSTPNSPQIKPCTLDDFRFAKTIAKKTVKPVLTGPVTLSKLSKGNFEKAIEIYTKLIENEVKLLSQEGAEYIQIDEPALKSEDLAKALPYLERIYNAKANPSTKIIYFFYFRDFSEDFESFQKIPADILGFDMTYSKLENIIARTRIQKPLMLGIVDGRNTYIEKPKDVILRIKKVLKNYPFDFMILSPSCGLEYLPRDFAFKKLQNLVKITEMLKKL